MKVCFKKGFYHGQFDSPYALGIIAKNIVSCNFNALCHVELRFSEAFGKMSFSSVEGEGSRFKQIDYSHPQQWIMMDWDLDDKRFPKHYNSEAEVHSLCQELSGRNYDWTGIVGQAIGVSKFNDKGTFYCSEIVATVMGFNDPEMSPAELYKAIKKLKHDR